MITKSHNRPSIARCRLAFTDINDRPGSDAYEGPAHTAVYMYVKVRSVNSVHTVYYTVTGLTMPYQKCPIFYTWPHVCLTVNESTKNSAS